MKLKFIIFCLSNLFVIKQSFGQHYAALDYIKDNAVLIDTNTNNLQDLSTLKSVFANRRVIGMGEATHGTQEFQTMKFKFLKYLVTQMQFKLFGIEANFTECRRVNDYVLYGKGDPKKAVAGMYFWTWNTTEVLRMVEWMRSYNLNKPMEQKVKFYGFDMQFEPYAKLQVTEKFEKLDSVDFNSKFYLIKNLKITNKDFSYKAFSIGKTDSINIALNQLNTYYNLQKSKLLTIYPKDEVAYLQRDIRLLQQCFDEAGANNRHVNPQDIRDQCMAENIKWILDYEGVDSKIMIWAHNGHVSKSGNRFKRMGNHLKEFFKDQYYVIGFDFNKGSFRAVEPKEHKLKTFTVSDAEKNSGSRFLSQFNIPAFFIDIENAVKTNSPGKAFFTKNFAQHSIGVFFSLDWKKQYSYIKNSFYNYYDGLIFINETTATLPVK